MRLLSFVREGTPSFGILTDRGVIDLGRRLETAPTLKAALADWEALAEFCQEKPDYSIDDVDLLPPVPDAGRILCVGLNYKSHIAETGRDRPDFPILFHRYPDSLVGAGATLVRPRASHKFDFEGELAFVIGRGGRHIPEEEAEAHIAGYACFNDGSIRDYQRHTSQFLPGKNFWRSGAFGPWLVTPDEAGPLEQLRLSTRLNGAEVQAAKLDDLLFGVPQLIAYISRIMPLNPGDVVATGTTGGVGAFRDPPLWMKPGDLVEVEIDRLGVLRNAVVDEKVGAGV